MKRLRFGGVVGPPILPLAAVLLLVPAAARAEYGGDDGMWIVSGGTSAELDYQATGSGSSATTLGLSLGLGHSMGAYFELMLLGSYQRQDNTGAATTSQGEIDGQLNLVMVGSHSDAFYLGARVGDLLVGNGSSTTSNFEFGGALGKRFPLGMLVSYEPNVAVMFTDNSGQISNPELRLVPLQFTLVF